MKNGAPNINCLWAQLLAEELVRCGVAFVGIAPGSRSSALALALSRHPRLTSVVHVDERGLAYHVLGWIRATGRPAAVVTTSGTAVANLMPAVAEAAQAHLPLLLLTADRPPELRDTGANQAMDQAGLFGRLVRWQADVPCPDDRLPARVLLTTVDQAVARATSLAMGGPVHLNLMFREPLDPSTLAYDRARALRGLSAWSRGESPHTRYVAPSDVGEKVWPAEVLERLARARRGVVVAGDLRPQEAEEVRRAAAALQWPLLPDLRSGLRLGVGSSAPVVAHADAVLASRAWFRERCDAVLHFGGSILSKRTAAWLAATAPSTYVQVCPWPERLDPSHQVTHRIAADPAGVARALTRAVRQSEDSTWLARWMAASGRVETALGRRARGAKTLAEPHVAWWLSRELPPGHALFAGNSLPVRLFQSFASSSGRSVTMGTQRGVSGIDGILAAAAGYARGQGAPVTLLVGDLSLLHDLNSLALLRDGVPLTVVVLNNDGGGIFSLLPVARSAGRRDFERVFGTPHGLRFREAARMFGLSYAAVGSPVALARECRKAWRSEAPALVEVQVRRSRTARDIRSWLDAAARAASV